MSILYALFSLVYLGWILIGLPEFLSSGNAALIVLALAFTSIPIAIFIFEELSNE
mgnify:FL=1